MKAERLLATVLFTDIVGSTERAAELGDRRWHDLLQEHDALVRRELARVGGREINTAGDSFVATFDAPEQAIRCACAIRDAVRELGIEVRSGLHSGEVHVMGETLGGIAVHIGARVAAKAAPGEVLVSSTVHDLVAGSGIEFEERGEHVLKGVPGQWRLFAVTSGSAGVRPSARRAWLARPRNLTLRGALPLLGLVLLIAAAWWTFKHRAISTVRASPTSIAVLPFSVRGNAEFDYLRAGMVELLSTKLDGAGSLRSVDPAAVLGLAEAEQEGVTDPERGRAIAQRLGAGLYILGSIVEAGGRLHLDAYLYDPTRGLEAVTRGTAEGQTNRLFELVDQLVGQLLAGQSGGPGARVTRIAAVTTSSLPALKAYLNGEAALRAGRFEEAIEAFQSAVATDSLFALAWYRLSVAAEWTARGALTAEAAEQAARHGSRLSEHDRLLLEAFLAWRRASPEAERRYRIIIASYPDDVEALFQLGEVLFHYGPPQGRSISESRAVWERVLQLDREHVLVLMHLARVAAVEGKRTEVDSLVARVARLSPEGDRLSEMRALQVFAQEDSASQERLTASLRQAEDQTVFLALWNVSTFAENLSGAQHLTQLLTEPSRSPEGQALGHVVLAHLELARGRFSAAKAALARAELLDPASAIEYRALFSAAPFLWVEATGLARLRNDLARWDAAATPPAVSRSSFLTIHNGLHSQLKLYLLGLFSARLGDQSAARRYADELEQLGRSAPVSIPEPQAASPTEIAAIAQNLAEGVRAQVAWRSGQAEEALRRLEQAGSEIRYNLKLASPFYSQPYERYLRAELLNSAGRQEEALRWYSSFEAHAVYDLVYQAPSLLKRAEIYERLGRRDLARDHYSRFIELWKDCDPELRPLLEEAERRIERLRSMT